MAHVKIAEINTAIHDALAQAQHLEYHQNFDEITEGILNTPVLQVYLQSKEASFGSETDRATFSKGVIQNEFVFYADLYLDQRAWSDQIFGQMYTLIDDLDEIFEGFSTKPYFGLPAIKAYHYNLERVSFEYGESTFPGVRWTLNIRVF